MRRESRLLLVLVVLAVGGVSALTVMSQRYGKLLTQAGDSAQPVSPAMPVFRPVVRTPQPPAVQPRPANPESDEPKRMEDAAQAYVDRFIVARREIRRSLVAARTLERVDDELLDSLLRNRDEVLLATSLGLAEYFQLRSIYRAWKQDGPGQGSTAFAQAFEQRRGQMPRIDLGVWESSEL